MSGGSGGPIIIRRKIRAAAELESVQNALPTAKRIRLTEILNKSDLHWTDEETHYVWRCVAHAYDCQQ